MSFRAPRMPRRRSASIHREASSSRLERACRRAVRAIFEPLEKRELLSGTTSTGGPLVTPAHIVVVIEEDRFANAIGDTTNMPYVNQIASTGLVYSNSHGLNNTSQEGEMNYLALYSGSTQGVTDNGFHGPFSGGNLAQLLNNAGLSFSGYAEGMPHSGDTTDALAAEPGNAAYDDLYVRSYNPMAQFSNVGTGVTNAQVNQTFASFPTTAAGYAALPTVSFVIPDTLDNTHGSNDTTPYATDPGEYNFLRQNADTWLKNNINGYLQWAKANNSLLIITGDEGDRAHGFSSLATNNLTTIINGSSNLFVAGTNTASITPYNLLRTIEDMYGLAPLGSSASASDLTTNSSGQLAPVASSAASTSTALASSVNPATFGQNVTFTATVTSSAGTPGGIVTFKDGSTTLGTGNLNASGVATFSTSALSAASHSIAAAFGGSSGFNASASSILAQVINPAPVTPTSTALTSSANPAALGLGINFTAVVSSSTSGMPTGTIQFQIDGANFGSAVALINGSATSATTSTLAAGGHTISAVYSGDTNFGGSSAPSLSETIAKGSSITSLATSASPSTFGASVTFTATVTGSAAITPTGTVTFSDGTTTLGTGTLNASGVATFSTSSLTVGTHLISASYAGNGNYTGSASVSLSQQVNPSTTTPVNDNFANATVISGTSITVTGSNKGATKETGEPNHGGNVGGHSVWWSWTAPSSGSVTITTKGSSFDTLLGVYTGSSVTTLTSIAQNDDDPAGGTTTSKVTFNAIAGTVYQIAVDGYGGATGTITLNVSLAAANTPLAPTGLTASNGTFGDGVHLAWTASAGASAYEVWRATTNSSSSATKVSTTDVTTTSFIDTTATAGQTYYYFVKAKNTAGTSGFSASASGYRATAGPINDNFANRIALSGTSVTVTGSNSNATKEAGEPNHGGNAGGRSVWYTWTAPSSGTVTIDTHSSNFDTLLGVYTGNSVSSLTTIAENDDDPSGGTTTSRVTFAVTAGTVYQIAVDGYGGAAGSITLNINLV
jgi:hypothetical protein